MRLLPIVAAVTAAFLVVSCSTPTPPQGVTVVNNFDAKRYLGTGTKLPALIIALNADWRRSRRLIASAMTVALLSSIKAGIRTGTDGSKVKEKPILPVTQPRSAEGFVLWAFLRRV